MARFEAEIEALAQREALLKAFQREKKEPAEPSKEPSAPQLRGSNCDFQEDMDYSLMGGTEQLANAKSTRAECCQLCRERNRDSKGSCSVAVLSSSSDTPPSACWIKARRALRELSSRRGDGRERCAEAIPQSWSASESTKISLCGSGGGLFSSGARRVAHGPAHRRPRCRCGGASEGPRVPAAAAGLRPSPTGERRARRDPPCLVALQAVRLGHG